VLLMLIRPKHKKILYKHTFIEKEQELYQR